MLFFNNLGLQIHCYINPFVAVWQALPGIFCRAMGSRGLKKYP